jgi:hypothetical protein
MPESGDHFGWVCDPGEGVLRSGLISAAKQLMGGFEIDHASKTPRFSCCSAS